MANKSGNDLPGPFSKGQVLTASDLNKIVDAISKRIVGGFGVEVRSANGNITITRLDADRILQVKARVYLVKEVHDNHLVCVLLDPDGDPVGGSSATEVVIAKPPELQRQNYDGLTIDGVTYTHVSATERSATDGVDIDEDHVIRPPYVEDVTKIVAIVIENGPGVADTIRMDTNNAARAWGVVVS